MAKAKIGGVVKGQLWEAVFKPGMTAEKILAALQKLAATKKDKDGVPYDAESITLEYVQGKLKGGQPKKPKKPKDDDGEITLADLEASLEGEDLEKLKAWKAKAQNKQAATEFLMDKFGGDLDTAVEALKDAKRSL